MKNIVTVIFCLVSLLFVPLVFAADMHAPASQESGRKAVNNASEKAAPADDFQKELTFRSQLSACNIKISNARGLGKVDEETSLRAERDKLKAEVLKTYGSLPSWWEEK